MLINIILKGIIIRLSTVIMREPFEEKNTYSHFQQTYNVDHTDVLLNAVCTTTLYSWCASAHARRRPHTRYHHTLWFRDQPKASAIQETNHLQILSMEVHPITKSVYDDNKVFTDEWSIMWMCKIVAIRINCTLLTYYIYLISFISDFKNIKPKII